MFCLTLKQARFHIRPFVSQDQGFLAKSSMVAAITLASYRKASDGLKIEVESVNERTTDNP